MKVIEAIVDNNNMVIIRIINGLDPLATVSRHYAFPLVGLFHVHPTAASHAAYPIF